MDMKEQRFGIEIELTGITRAKAAQIIGLVTARPVHGYEIIVPGREGAWQVKCDASIRVEHGQDVEIVSPICIYEDIPTIQKIVREVRRAGGKVNESCGIHIHIDAQPHTAKSIKNLVNIIASKEDIIFHALKVQNDRERYCKKTDRTFLDELNRGKKDTLQKIRDIWYAGHRSDMTAHYNATRYHALNLHALYTKKTIEFRMFNSTLHAGEIKAYIQFCLAVSYQALTQERAICRKTQTGNECYTFRTWLLRLGLIGDEYKTARMHLLKNLSGDIAWRYGNGRAA